MRSDLFSRLSELRSRRKAVVVLTDVDGGDGELVAEGEVVREAISEPVALAFRNGNSFLADIEGRRVFLNVYLPPVRIVVTGAVHISQVLAPVARLAGFDLQIIDPREAFATLERFPETDVLIDWPQDVLSVDPYTALVAVSHVPDIDDSALKKALEEGCFYVGALGSRKSHAARLDRLRGQGMDEALLGRIRAPIGLDIGAANPAEIAVSIMAEIIQALRQRDVSAAGK